MSTSPRKTSYGLTLTRKEAGERARNSTMAARGSQSADRVRAGGRAGRRRHWPFRCRSSPHSFEWARLLLTLDAAETTSPAWLLEAATALFDTAVADEWQRDGHPGLIYTVDSDGQSVVTARMHWVACEAVLAADALHRRTGEDASAQPRRGGGMRSTATSWTARAAAAGRSLPRT